MAINGPSTVAEVGHAGVMLQNVVGIATLRNARCHRIGAIGLAGVRPATSRPEQGFA